jgi:hypothetical protein
VVYDFALDEIRVTRCGFSEKWAKVVKDANVRVD